jgi:hypothetical protein
VRLRGKPVRTLSKNFLTTHQVDVDLWTKFLCRVYRENHHSCLLYRILLANLLQSSRSTFSRGSILSFFAFKEGMLGTPISVLGGWPTVSARFLHTAVGIQIPLPVPTHARVTYKKLGQDMRYACSIRPRLVKPTVSLGVTSAVVSSCGHASGHIEQPVAHEWAGHWATHEGPAERPQHRRPPQAQTLSPVEAFPVKT